MGWCDVVWQHASSSVQLALLQALGGHERFIVAAGSAERVVRRWFGQQFLVRTMAGILGAMSGRLSATQQGRAGFGPGFGRGIDGSDFK